VTLESYLKKQSIKVEKALDAILSAKGGVPVNLAKAVRYALFAGGKRVRPILVLAACEAVGGKEKDAMPAACALELIHNYSLVHDDLPCMDDDDVRRGKPTCHIKFGEATALLAGDALLTLAFEVMADTKLEAVRLLAQAAGSQGMVGGQQVDMDFQGKEMDLPTVQYINTHKTGDLIAVSFRLGAILGGGKPAQIKNLYEAGKCAGLLFQIVDDILDKEGYATVIGLPEAKIQAQRLREKAKKHLKPLGRKADILAKIIDFIADRDY
jgi:geranylgeranyl diphosphate synthase type II